MVRVFLTMWLRRRDPASSMIIAGALLPPTCNTRCTAARLRLGWLRDLWVHDLLREDREVQDLRVHSNCSITMKQKIYSVRVCRVSCLLNCDNLSVRICRVIVILFCFVWLVIREYCGFFICTMVFFQIFEEKILSCYVTSVVCLIFFLFVSIWTRLIVIIAHWFPLAAQFSNTP